MFSIIVFKITTPVINKKGQNSKYDVLYLLYKIYLIRNMHSFFFIDVKLVQDQVWIYFKLERTSNEKNIFLYI